jgi:hypothetical protein
VEEISVVADLSQNCDALQSRTAVLEDVSDISAVNVGQVQLPLRWRQTAE